MSDTWKIMPHDTNEETGNADFSIMADVIRMDGMGENVCIADVYDSEEIAKLIAAAPDLLSAAQAMLAKLENLTVAEFERGGERAEREALAKAIAKACQS